MKISIIGAAGCIGSSIAFNIAAKGLADEIVLADIRQDWLKKHYIEQIVDILELYNESLNSDHGKNKMEELRLQNEGKIDVQEEASDGAIDKQEIANEGLIASAKEHSKNSNSKNKNALVES